MCENKAVQITWVVCQVLILIGALNWGLIGLFDFNLVSYLFGEDTTFTNVIYIIVGACALISAILSIICAFNKRDEY